MAGLLDALLRLVRGTRPSKPVPGGIAGPVTREPQTQKPQTRPGRAGGQAAAGERAAYPGDFRGVPEMTYAARPDGRPDPGEVVWTWVPFEEDHSQGKDRPVLLIGWEQSTWLLGLQLTSKDHDRDAAQEARHGRYWIDIGTGGWDRQGRPSEVRVNRILRIAPDAIRREGAILAREVFEEVADAVRAAAR